MRMALTGALAAIVGVGCAAAAQAQERKCEINAYTIDDDPQGINIRGGPSAQAKIVAVITKRKKEDEVQVSIAAERDGWFRITEYSHFEVTKDVKVNGWLHGSRLAAGLMTALPPARSRSGPRRPAGPGRRAGPGGWTGPRPPGWPAAHRPPPGAPR